MHLLVSVSSAAEAAAALAGGADLVDAKDPSAGALGAVSDGALRGIVAAVSGARPVSAALGDARDEAGAAARADRKS
ncbi:MAG: (5-formylfuran-3-yl)methyl phosphate synthase, partial [Gemmatimonadaceae bacterium]